MQMTFRRVDWQFRTVFRISSGVQTHTPTVVVEVRSEEFVGRGEGLVLHYLGETPESLLEQVRRVAEEAMADLTRSALQELMPPGGARNAIDCALWDLEAQRSGVRAWESAKLPDVRPLQTYLTLALDHPAAMARAASAAGSFPLLKVKLGAVADDLARVRAVREARPDAQIAVDANQGWLMDDLRQLAPELEALGVLLIEQPLPLGADQALLHYSSPIPLCADESCQTRSSLPSLLGKYSHVNIKLDKTGGLSEALELARAAKAAGFRLMVGCMGGSSLSMAPAFLIGQQCEFVDLDGPLLLTEDVPNAMRYEGAVLFPPSEELWG